jgi:3-hydroxypropanoate dehydrogenase
VTTHQPLPDASLDQIFRTARTQNAWTDTPVSETLLRAVYDLMRFGPTSANCSPARIVFVTTPEGKARLLPHLSGNNSAKTAKAPAVAIIGHDMKFYDKIPQLFPHAPEAREWFANDAKVAEMTAFRNGTLQGAYFMIAARSLGLDCGPMSGFNNAGVDAEFFAGTDIKSNFLCSVGHGDPAAVFPRSPRLSFEEACQLV